VNNFSLRHCQDYDYPLPPAIGSAPESLFMTAQCGGQKGSVRGTDSAKSKSPAVRSYVVYVL